MTGFLTFEQARQLAYKARIYSASSFADWNPKPFGMPDDPKAAYFYEWRGWNQFLSASTILTRESESLFSLGETVDWIAQNDVKDPIEYKRLRTPQLPSDPAKLYGTTWKWLLSRPTIIGAKPKLDRLAYCTNLNLQ